MKFKKKGRGQNNVVEKDAGRQTMEILKAEGCVKSDWEGGELVYGLKEKAADERHYRTGELWIRDGGADVMDTVGAR